MRKKNYKNFEVYSITSPYYIRNFTLVLSASQPTGSVMGHRGGEYSSDEHLSLVHGAVAILGAPGSIISPNLKFGILQGDSIIFGALP